MQVSCIRGIRDHHDSGRRRRCRRRIIIVMLDVLIEAFPAVLTVIIPAQVRLAIPVEAPVITITMAIIFVFTIFAVII